MKNKLTRLTIRVIQPPISIFEIGSGKEIERTYAYESAFANAEDYFFMVPDGRFKVTQGKLVCCYDVKGGKVVELKPKEGKAKDVKEVKDVKGTPKEVVKGVTLDDVVTEQHKTEGGPRITTYNDAGVPVKQVASKKKDKNSVTGIMHVGESDKK